MLTKEEIFPHRLLFLCFYSILSNFYLKKSLWLFFITKFKSLSFILLFLTTLNCINLKTSIFLNFKCKYNLCSILKYLPNININNLDIINQKTDKIYLRGELKNFNKFFNKIDLDKFLNHGVLKTDYSIQFFKKGSSHLIERKFSTYNTFTSVFESSGIKNYKLGSQIRYPLKTQLINLNKTLHTDNSNIILDLNDSYFLKFYNHYLKNKTAGLEINQILLNKMYKYQECYNLIDLNYKQNCIQAVNVLYLKNTYSFEVISYIQPIIN